MNEIPWYIQSQHFYEVTSNFHVIHEKLTKEFPSHRHDFIEIEFVASGEGTEIINGVEYKIRRGSISVLLPWHVHKILFNAENPLETYKCSFGSELFLDDNTPFFELSDIIFRNTVSLPVVDLDPADCNKVIGLFHELLQEYANVSPWRDTLIKAKISEILICFDRNRQSEKSSEETKPQNQSSPDIWKIVQYIHESFNKDITISETAKKFHYSDSYLNKLLKQNIGLNFNDMIQEIRIRNACAYLKYPMATINDVASTVGFKSQESFYRAFKNVKGVSPENYRKLILSHRGNDEKVTTFSVLNAQIVYYLHLHYNENITLSSLAKRFNYNETYLSNELTNNGVNFVSLLHEIRIYHACTFLLTTDLSINQIGYNVGFDSAETFFRVFKKLRKTSPGEYRKSHLSANSGCHIP